MIAALAVAAAMVVVPAQEPEPGRTVLAFVPGVAWEAPGAAVGALTTATARTPFCAADIAVTLSAGRRATVGGNGCAVPAVVGGRVAGWDAIVRANESRHFGARPGSLTSGVEASDGCVSASGPLAAVAAARPDGTVPPARTGSTCTVSVTDLTGAGTLAAALAAVRRDHPDATRTVLVSLPRRGHLGAVAVLPGSGLLRGSTRRDGVVALTDVASYVTGVRSITTVGGSAATLPDLDRREHLRRPYAGFYVAGLIALPMLLYIWLAFGRRRAGPRARAVALVLATYPAAGFVSSLVPWWRASVAWPLAVACVVAGMAGVFALGVLAARALRAAPEVGIAAVSVLVFVADLLTGGYLQRTGVGSYPTITGGRFYGLGNNGFAVLTTSAVIVAGAAARRYGPRAWLGLLPVVALVALPVWGADFGGAITLTAALVAALAVRSRRALVLGVVAGVVVALGVALLDYARPPESRTHLGRFVGELANGGWSDTVARKAGAAAHSFVTWYPLLVVGSAAIAYVLLRRFDDRVTARAVVVLLAVGSLVNDSGLVVAAFGAAVAVPLLVSYVERRA
ncbi:MAG TPA: hypothetical protein VNA20_17765 [Frankiaceae bacterium]|nr:hypothetical protein [Frankiaceae bacterium]